MCGIPAQFLQSILRHLRYTASFVPISNFGNKSSSTISVDHLYEAILKNETDLVVSGSVLTHERYKHIDYGPVHLYSHQLTILSNMAINQQQKWPFSLVYSFDWKTWLVLFLIYLTVVAIDRIINYLNGQKSNNTVLKAINMDKCKILNFKIFIRLN